MSAGDVDSLLERYLDLLDEYTKLRSALTALQTNIYQNIARANFSAERGIRYGRDMYDERMQASRALTVMEGNKGTPVFEIGLLVEEKSHVKAEEEASQDKEKDVNGIETGKEREPEMQNEDEKEKQSQDKKQKAQSPRDPLRWFGILTPVPLRQAQSKSIEAVEKIIPKLVTVSAQMADVEIRVRRARKKRAKGEAAVLKQHQQVPDGEGASAREGQALVSDADLEAHVEKLVLHDEDGHRETLTVGFH